MDLRHDPSTTRGRSLAPQIYSLSWVVSQILGVGVISRLPLSRFFPAVFVARREYSPLYSHSLHLFAGTPQFISIHSACSVPESDNDTGRSPLAPPSSLDCAVDLSSLICDCSAEFLPILQRAVQANLASYVLYGLVDGFFNMTLVAYTLFWYPTEQVALRFLLWYSVSSQGSRLLQFVLQWRFSWAAGYALSMVLYFIVQIAGKHDLLGSPREVSWLSTEQKVMYSQMAASQRLLANITDSRPMWRRQQVGHILESPVVWSCLFLALQQSFLTRCAQPLLVFVVSLLHTISSGLVFASYMYKGRGFRDLDFLRIILGLLLFAVPVGLISYKFPPTSCKYGVFGARPPASR